MRSFPFFVGCLAITSASFLACGGDDETGTVTARAPPATTYTLPARTAENGSYYGQPNTNGVPKTVYVDGYYRSDGTYVRGHYRSAPGSNPR